MNLPNDRGKNALVSLQFFFFLLYSKFIVFYFIFIAVPIALIPLEAAIREDVELPLTKFFLQLMSRFLGIRKFSAIQH